MVDAENVQEEQPTRKKFNEEVAERAAAMVDSLVHDCPELRGMVVQFIWDIDIPAKDLPFGLIRGKDIDDPLMRLRCLEQTTKMLRTETEGIFETLHLADQALMGLNKKISDKQQEIRQQPNESEE